MGVGIDYEDVDLAQVRAHLLRRADENHFVAAGLDALRLEDDVAEHQAHVHWRIAVEHDHADVLGRQPVNRRTVVPKLSVSEGIVEATYDFMDPVPRRLLGCYWHEFLTQRQPT